MTEKATVTLVPRFACPGTNSQVTDHKRKDQMLKLQRWMTLAAFVLVSALGLGTAQAANITASEVITGGNEIATLVGSQFDVSPFVAVNGIESSDATGAFLANQPASGQALVVLLESPGGPFSDW